MHPAELKSSAAIAGIIAAIFDVLAFTTGRPSHGFLLLPGTRIVALGRTGK
jgi:hypothetical protein